MSTDLQSLRDLVARLRGPGGCPWDREQELGDLRAYLLEEAHEVAAAMDETDWENLADELGDLLFQVVFIAAVSEEGAGHGVADSIARVEQKMIARHPHVFGDAEAKDAEAVRQAWERRKVRDGRDGSVLDGVASSLPALVAAYRMTQKAAGVGFDWPAAEAVLEKAEEEIAELRAALGPATADQVREEVGDLLFTIANLARKLEIDPEAALAQTNLKFRRRFAYVERGLAARGRNLGEATLEEMDALWDEAKRQG